MSDRKPPRRADRPVTGRPAGIAVMAALLSIAYFADAYGASSRIHNIILLTPLTGGVALLALVVVGAHAARATRRRGDAGGDGACDGPSPASLWRR